MLSIRISATHSGSISFLGRASRLPATGGTYAPDAGVRVWEPRAREDVGGLASQGAHARQTIREWPRRKLSS